MVKKHLRSCQRPFHAAAEGFDPLTASEAPEQKRKKRRGRSPAALMDRMVRRNQRRSCRTLWFDWLASDSADVAIDWRVDSARLFGASSLVAASGKGGAP